MVLKNEYYFLNTFHFLQSEEVKQHSCKYLTPLIISFYDFIHLMIALPPDIPLHSSNYSKNIEYFQDIFKLINNLLPIINR